MLRSWKKVAVSTVLAIGLGAGSAQAAPIIGSIGVSDGLAGLPTAPSTSVVSALTGFTHDPTSNGLSTGCTDDFVGSCGALNAVMTDWVFGASFPNIIVVNGFTFDLTGIGAITATPLSCHTGTCGDALVISGLVGTVTKAGFDPTTFTGTLTLSGSCIGAAGVCTRGIAGTYAYALSATGSAVTPEPQSLLLIGVGLVGLGFVRRKRS